MNTTTAESSTQSALQVQNRVLNFAAQMEKMQSQLDQLLFDIQSNNSQVSALTQHLTSPQSVQPMQEQLVELAAQVDANQSQMETLVQSLNRAMSQMQSTQGQLETLNNSISRGFTQVESRQGQLESLSHTITHSLENAIRQEDLDALAATLKKFSRTQFKANALGETKEQQITDALNAIRDMATKREAVQDRFANRDQAQLETARTEARGELAAELLPALDSLELAIENGYEMVARQEQRTESHMAKVSSFQPAPVVVPPKPPPTLWQRLFGGAAQEMPSMAQPSYQLSPVAPPASPKPEFLTEAVDDVSAWIEGLELVHERFLGILRLENIIPIPAVNQPFDPRLHVAVEAVVRDDIPTQTVIRELRKGYRQGNRVLRYSEVVVAKGSEPAIEPPLDPTRASAMAEADVDDTRMLGFIEQTEAVNRVDEPHQMDEAVIAMPSTAETYTAETYTAETYTAEKYTEMGRGN